MTNLELATKWVNDLVDNNFKYGWGGDRSPRFRQKEIDIHLQVIEGTFPLQAYEIIAMLTSDENNLRQYCSWTEAETMELLSMFGIDGRKELHSLYQRPSRETKALFKNNKYCREGDTLAIKVN